MIPARQIMKSVALPVWPSGLTRIDIEADVRMEYGLEPEMEILLGAENWDAEGMRGPLTRSAAETMDRLDLIEYFR